MPTLGQAIPYLPGTTLVQPVTGAPTPTAGSTQQTTQSGGGTGGSSFQAPTPNPYNLPDDLVQGQPQDQQLGGLLGQFEQSRQGANAANEARYQQAIAGYQQLDQDYANRTQQLLGQLQGYGEGYRQDLADRFKQQEAGLTQDMINRGLYNATTLDQARQGLSRQQQRQQLNLEDMLTRQQMDYARGITGEELANRPRILEAIERRTDVGPSYQDVAGVAGAAGQSMAGVPDYLSALGGEGTARTGTGGVVGGGGSPLRAPQLQQYRTPSTYYAITSRGGSGIANPLSLSGSRSSRSGRTGSFGGQSGAGGAGSPTDTGTGSSTAGTTTDRSGSQVNQSVQGGSGSGKAVTIFRNDDGSYYDAVSGETYGSYEELMKARQQSTQGQGQTPQPGAAGPAQAGATGPAPAGSTEQPQSSGYQGTPTDPSMDKPQSGYTGGGVQVPGIPYPVDPATLSKEQLMQATAWEGSATSQSRLDNYRRYHGIK